MCLEPKQTYLFTTKEIYRVAIKKDIQINKKLYRILQFFLV